MVLNRNKLLLFKNRNKAQRTKLWHHVQFFKRKSDFVSIKVFRFSIHVAPLHNMPKQILVNFIPLRTCLVNLPPQWTAAFSEQNKAPQNVVLELSWLDPFAGGQTRKAYVGWSGTASTTQTSAFPKSREAQIDVLEIDPQFGQSIGLQNGQKVNIEFCKQIADGFSVHVEPYSEDDWEILELHAGYVEENLLSQIRVVYQEQIITIWIHGRTLVRLKIVELDPKASCIKLTNAEVIVAPKVRKTNGLPSLAEQQPAESLNMSGALSVRTESTSLRYLPLGYISSALPSRGISTIFVNPQNWGAPIARVSKLQYVQSTHSGKNDEEEKSDKEDGSTFKNYAKAIFTNVMGMKEIPVGHVVFGDEIQEMLDAEDFAVISLQEPKMEPIAISSLILRRVVQPSSTSSLKLETNNVSQHNHERQGKSADIIRDFTDWTSRLPTEGNLIFTNNMHFRMPLLSSKSEDPIRILVQLGPAKPQILTGTNIANKTMIDLMESYVLLTGKIVDKVKIELGEPVIFRGEKFSTDMRKQNIAPTFKLGGVETILSKAQKYLKACLARESLRNTLQVPVPGGILLTGAHGSGKTSIVNELSHLLSKDIETLAYYVNINCSEATEDRILTFKEKLQQWFDDAAWHAPSIIFFDDLDRLIPAEIEHADSFRSRQFAELFLAIASKMRARHQIAIIATSQQQASIHPLLVKSHVFSELIHVNPPGKNERKEILESIMSSGPPVLVESLPKIDCVSIATNTEGYLAADLKALVDRAVHEGVIRSINVAKEKLRNDVATSNEVLCEVEAQIQEAHVNSELTLLQKDFENAQEGFVPSSLRGVKLQSSEVSWSDIGGLNETKKTLLETLEWPTKYAAIFAASPLRLRSGLLLYGFPGCGKTLLASAIAKECGLNFISVKGPELLNKYIGASEKSVRDLFDRAQAARPCVLFFDEFDSIAPKRGHDSTGVTDRVVNQMLTQMDGAEGLEGVYVLAATSRPDLIDSALLRPGRLDKSLLCGMPTVKERLEILQSLSQKMRVDPSVDLESYAEKTDGFSGADLQALLYNAHLESIHDAINLDSMEKSVRVTENESSTTNDVQFTTFEANSPNHGDLNKGLTLAERGQISQRLELIKRGHSKRREIAPNQKMESSKRTTAITNEHLQKSLRETRPSITPEERRRLENIYHEFTTGRTGEMPNGEAAKGIGKRTTLG